MTALNLPMLMWLSWMLKVCLCISFLGSLVVLCNDDQKNLGVGGFVQSNDYTIYIPKPMILTQNNYYFRIFIWVLFIFREKSRNWREW